MSPSASAVEDAASAVDGAIPTRPSLRGFGARTRHHIQLGGSDSIPRGLASCGGARKLWIFRLLATYGEVTPSGARSCVRACGGPDVWLNKRLSAVLPNKGCVRACGGPDAWLDERPSAVLPSKVAAAFLAEGNVRGRGRATIARHRESLVYTTTDGSATSVGLAGPQQKLLVM